MQQYDISLKLLLRGPGSAVLRGLTGGAAVQRWLDVELPEVRNTRVDLLGETAAGDLVHIELQSTNDPTMALRMAEYCLRVYRLFDRFPRQILLYVGDPPLRMPSELTGPNVTFRYETVDIRDLDGDGLLESDQIGDNVIAILARLRDRRLAVHRILTRIAKLDRVPREYALGQLFRISGLRRLEEFVEQEAGTMPILIDLMENKVLGREIRRGIRIGEAKMLRLQMEARFGPIPDWAEKHIADRSPEELEALAVRVLNAESLEQLLS
jgi:hypothetical protein